MMYGFKLSDRVKVRSGGALSLAVTISTAANLKAATEFVVPRSMPTTLPIQ
jgi:hypothetical protein